MGRYFEVVHETPSSQLGSERPTVSDTPEIAALREKVSSSAHGKDRSQALLDLALCLVFSLRYTEAVEVLTEALEEDKDNTKALRVRAIRNMTTLHAEDAVEDFLELRAVGYPEDTTYQLGLSYYLSGMYREAMEEMEACYIGSTDEMKVAAIYWHAAASFAVSEEPSLLALYHSGMEVGHHTAYDSALKYLSGIMGEEEYRGLMEKEESDLEYSMLAYGLVLEKRRQGLCGEVNRILSSILSRDSFWISFAYIAAYNDVHYHGQGRKHNG